MRRILFLCTGNSCRSQMAEGWARALRAGDIEAFSAGTKPEPVSAEAIHIMAEAGVDISGHRSKLVTDLAGREFDLVITLCDSARQACPAFPGAAETRHQPFEDPKDATGTEEERLAVFRRVRDEIRDFVAAL